MENIKLKYIEECIHNNFDKSDLNYIMKGLISNNNVMISFIKKYILNSKQYKLIEQQYKKYTITPYLTIKTLKRGNCDVKYVKNFFYGRFSSVELLTDNDGNTDNMSSITLQSTDAAHNPEELAKLMSKAFESVISYADEKRHIIDNSKEKTFLTNSELEHMITISEYVYDSNAKNTYIEESMYCNYKMESYFANDSDVSEWKQTYGETVYEMMTYKHEPIYVSKFYWENEFNILNILKNTKHNTMFGNIIETLWKNISYSDTDQSDQSQSDQSQSDTNQNETENIDSNTVKSNDTTDNDQINILEKNVIEIILEKHYKLIEVFHIHIKNSSELIDNDAINKSFDYISYLEATLGLNNLSIGNCRFQYTGFGYFYEILLIITSFLTILDHTRFMKKKDVYKSIKESYVYQRSDLVDDDIKANFNTYISKLCKFGKKHKTNNIFTKNNISSMNINHILRNIRLYLTMHFLKMTMNINFFQKDEVVEESIFRSKIDFVNNILTMITNTTDVELNGNDMLLISRFIHLEKYCQMFMDSKIANFFVK